MSKIARIFFASVAATCLLASSAYADPWVAVDASPNGIMFLNYGAMRNIDANTKDVEVLVGVRSGAPVLMRSKFQVRCREGAVAEYSRAFLETNGNFGASQPINLQFVVGESGTMGHSLVSLACAGIQVTNVGGVRRPTLIGAVDFVKYYFSDKTPR